MLFQPKIHQIYNRKPKIQNPPDQPGTSGTFECDMCGVKVRRRDHLIAHMWQKQSDNTEKFKCEFCQKEYGYKSIIKSAYNSTTYNGNVQRVKTTNENPSMMKANVQKQTSHVESANGRLPKVSNTNIR